jgi:Flp pilus assembly pilin Flp
MSRNLVSLAKSDRGQGLLEYALVVSLVAIACYATLVLMGNRLTNNTYGLANKQAQWNQ